MLVPAEGIEPIIHRLSGDCSTTKLRWQCCYSGSFGLFSFWAMNRAAGTNKTPATIIKAVEISIVCSFFRVVPQHGIEPRFLPYERSVLPLVPQGQEFNALARACRAGTRRARWLCPPRHHKQTKVGAFVYKWSNFGASDRSRICNISLMRAK